MRECWRLHIMSIENPVEQVLKSAGVIAGGKRLLDQLSGDYAAERVVLGACAADQVRELAKRAERETVVILASGDPMYCGIGGTAAKFVPPEHLCIYPGVTAFQRLFARLGRPWNGAELFSLHGTERPLPWRRILNAGIAVVYGDHRRTASGIAKELCARYPAASGRSAAIGCCLGMPEERVFPGTLGELAEKEVSALSVLAVFPSERRPGLPLGLPDAEYRHSNQMITHPEVRAVVLAKLRAVSGVMWDLGAGSGSVGLEAAGLAFGLTVYAVEKNPERAGNLRSNAMEQGIALEVVEGTIADAMPGMPDPDYIFFGGGSAELETAFARLRPGGTLVATAVLVETAARLASSLPEYRTELLTLNVSRAGKTAAGEFWRAENPITIAVFRKKEE